MNYKFATTYLKTFCPLFFGCLGCFLLRNQFGWSPLLAASTLNFAITFLHLPEKINAKEMQVIFCTGTFAGMSGGEIMPDAWHVLAVSLLGSGIFILVKPYFHGLGGKLGAIAFVSAFIWLLIKVAE